MSFHRHFQCHPLWRARTWDRFFILVHSAWPYRIRCIFYYLLAPHPLLTRLSSLPWESSSLQETSASKMSRGVWLRDTIKTRTEENLIWSPNRTCGASSRRRTSVGKAGKSGQTRCHTGKPNSKRTGYRNEIPDRVGPELAVGRFIYCFSIFPCLSFFLMISPLLLRWSSSNSSPLTPHKHTHPHICPLVCGRVRLS